MPKDPTTEMGGAPNAPLGADATGVAAAGATFFGHPRGLSTLFFTEMWERFSYYGMRAILILFMTRSVAEGGLGFDASRAGAIYGLYTAFVYLTALPGGWIADKLIGQRKAVLYGGIVIALGHFTMALPGLISFYLGLAFIVIGTGLLKPNVSTLVGGLYREDEPARRDAGFSIFYMGINLGAFIAPLIVGWVGEKWNWHYGFGIAGIGMVAGLVQYVLMSKHLGDVGLRPSATVDRPEGAKPNTALAVVIALVVVVLIGGLQLSGTIDMRTAEGLASAAGVIILMIAVSYLGFIFFAGGLTRVEKHRMTVIAILLVFSALFWAGFEQAGSSLNLFAIELTDRVVLGWEMPASWLQSVNALMIISLAPVFAWLWVWLSRRKREPAAPGKFSYGLVFLGLGFFVMVGASVMAQRGVQVSPMWLVLTYLLHTIGELSLSPVGLSTVTKLAPQRMVGQMMGVWFMAVSLGNLIAGQVAGLFDTLPLPQLFGAVAAVTAGAGLILAVIAKPMKKLMHGVH